MINEYIRYRLSPEASAGFEQAYRVAATVLASSEHCVDYELSQCVEDPGCHVLRIRWTSAEAHLQGFRRSPGFATFFQAIKAYVPHIEEMRHYAATAVSGSGGAVPQPPTLLAWAGGLPALTAFVDDFYARVGQDDLLQPLFGHMHPDHPRRVARWLAEVFGGEADYSRHHGGHPEMLKHHLNRAITEPQRRRWVDLLVDAADATGLPDDPEFRASFMGYIEWGTRLAKAFSQPGATPDLHEPVPTWGWVRPPWPRADTPEPPAA